MSPRSTSFPHRTAAWHRTDRCLSSLSRGFTLVEIMIVVLMLAILASLVGPTLANATAPLPRTIGDVLEADFRRARVEAISTVREMHLVVAADRAQWWLQPAGAPDAATALPSSTRILGLGNLAPFDGVLLEPTINGGKAPSAATPFAIFSTDGLRSSTRLEIALVNSATTKELIRWRAQPQRTQLTEVPPPAPKDTIPTKPGTGGK